MRRNKLVCTLILFSVNFTACQRKPQQQSSSPSATTSSADNEDAVPFDITPISSNNGAEQWLATYTAKGKTARFRIEFYGAKPAGDKTFNFTFGKGRFLPEPNSDPSELLQSLKKALEAKNLPGRVPRAKELPFEYAVLGEKLSGPESGFSNTTPGDWRAMKIFLANDEAEVFLNANPVVGKAEFSIKDPDYGDRLLEELAKVL